MNIDELLNRYAAGDRDFGAINLPRANLTGLDLSGANLSGANLSGTQLRGAIEIKSGVQKQKPVQADSDNLR